MGAEGALHQPFLAYAEKVKYPADAVHIFMAHLRPRAVAAILVRAFQEYYAVCAKLKGPQDQRLIDASDAHHPYQVKVRGHVHRSHRTASHTAAAPDTIVAQHFRRIKAALIGDKPDSVKRTYLHATAAAAASLPVNLGTELMVFQKGLCRSSCHVCGQGSTRLESSHSLERPGHYPIDADLGAMKKFKVVAIKFLEAEHPHG